MTDTELKVVFLGESTVGKTSIISAFSHNTFIPEQTPTIGACFSLQRVKVKDTYVKVKIWDTAGQERFRALTPIYYRDAQAAILVYAVDARDTFDKLDSWLADLKRETVEMPPVIIVGNKTDLDRSVTMKEAEAFAENVGATYMETSAKTNDGIQDLLCSAALLAVDSLKIGEPTVVENIVHVREEKEPSRKKQCMC